MKKIITSVFFCLLYWALLAQNVPVLVKDLYTALNSSNPNGFIQADSLVFFKTDKLLNSPVGIPRSTGIWSSDGTTAGTVVIDQDTVSGRVFSSLAAIEEQVFFIKTDWLDYQTGVHSLFRATTSNPLPVQINEAWTSTFHLGTRQPVAHKGKVFFVKNNHIWQSDGTNNGTVLYFAPPADPAPNYERRVGDLVSNGDSLYFLIYRWQLDGPNSTGDLWSISGDAGDPGTPLWENVYIATNGGGGASGRPAALSTIHRRAMLTVTQVSVGGGNSIVGPVTTFSPGFAAFSTGNITVNGGSLDYRPVVSGDRLFVLTHEEVHVPFGQPIQRNNELWVTPADGPRQLLKRFAAQTNGSGQQIGSVGNLVFFAADDSTGAGQELWRSDGTPDGTFLLLDIHPGGADADINGFAHDSSHVYFSAFNGTGWNIWKSNGLPGGTVKLADFPTTSVEPPIGEMFMLGDRLYFSGNDGVTGFELWTYLNGVVSNVQSTEKMDFQLFPNPANGSVVIKMPAPMAAAEGRIFDQLGCLVKAFPIPANIDHTLVVDLFDLKSGVYLLQITESDVATGVKKLVVNREK